MKEKLKRYALVLLVGLPLLLYLSLGLVYLEQKRGQTEALAHVSTSLELLRRPAPDLKGLEAGIAQAEQEIAQVRGLFAQESSDVLVAGLLERAQRSGLNVVGIAAKPVTIRKEEDRSYSILPFSVQLAGGTGQLLGFLNSLDYPNLEVQSASLTQVQGSQAYNISMDIVVHLTPRE